MADMTGVDEGDDRFRFSLTDEEKEFLKELARTSIKLKLQGGKSGKVPDPPTDRLREKFGAFVCLKRRKQLRGCIGHIVGDKPLHETIWDMARCAAFQDPRFPALSPPELDELEIEISILSPLELCPDPNQIEVGRHGLLIRKGFRQGLLLPQVPVEWKWDREVFLRQTCCKAGLEQEAWRDPDTEIFWFEAEIF